MPVVEMNWLAIGIAVLANFVLGFIWYTPLFGKVWAKEIGFDFEEKPENAIFVRALLLMIIGNFLMAYVFFHNIAVWNPITWGQSPSEMSAIAMAGNAAFFTWLGFYVPNDLSGIAWEKKSWKLFGINTGYNFVSLLIVAIIITHI